MPQGFTGEPRLERAPRRQMPIQQRDELGVMPAHPQMAQFMDDNVLQALRRLLDQLQVEPDAARLGVATQSSQLNVLTGYAQAL